MFKKTCLVISIMIFISLNIFARENRSTTKKIKHHPEYNFSLRLLSIGNKNKIYDRKFLNASSKDREKFDDSRPSQIALGYDFKLSNNFSTSSVIKYEGADRSGFIVRDQDVLDGDGNQFRLVEKEEEFDYSEYGIEQSLIYNHPLSINWWMRPYVGVGYSSGNEKFEQHWMTDRKKELLFSKHNRYTLVSQRKFKKGSAFVGLEFVYKKLLIDLKYRFDKIKTRGEIQRRSVNSTTEEFVFSDSDYNFAIHDKSNNSFIVGIGLKF